MVKISDLCITLRFQSCFIKHSSPDPSMLNPPMARFSGVGFRVSYGQQSSFVVGAGEESANPNSGSNLHNKCSTERVRV